MIVSVTMTKLLVESKDRYGTTIKTSEHCYDVFVATPTKFVATSLRRSKAIATKMAVVELHKYVVKYIYDCIV